MSALLRPWRRVGWAAELRNRVLLAVVVGASLGALYESRTSAFQASVFSRLAQGLSYDLAPEADPRSPAPRGGPYERRLGYDRLGQKVGRLESQDFTVTAQARLSPDLRRLVERHGFAVYPEKTQAGLTLLDRHGQTILARRYPERVYGDFAAVPEVLVDALSFIEDRDLLSATPRHNPALDWSRLPVIAAALLQRVGDPAVKVPGGSTLATQTVKYRHFPGGQTSGAADKLEQIWMASLKAYLEGPETERSRRQVLVDYLNSTPLAARPGFGEVNGLGDGLYAWYGVEFGAANALLDGLHKPALNPDGPQIASAAVSDSEVAADPGIAPSLEQARVFKQALSLMLAQRRPSYYLLDGRDELRRLTDSHLRVLASAGVISPALRDATLPLALEPGRQPIVTAAADQVTEKIARTLRADLVTALDEASLYDLDRLDMTVRSTLDAPVQAAVSQVLQELGDPRLAEAHGLLGPNLLSRGDPARIAYSVTLFERRSDGNYLRVRADNLDRPLDLNTGSKLDLGSTAKLRTLVTCLHVVALLHQRYAGLTDDALAKAAPADADRLTGWAIDYLRGTRDRSLRAMLDAAMGRSYSASPAERFFTGGGLHSFANFDSKDDHRIVTVGEAMRFSINLAFIRLMRDVVSFYMRETEPGAAALLRDPGHPVRARYLASFADKEGSTFLTRFYRLYAGKTRDEILELAASRARQRPNALAVVYRSLRPDDAMDGFAAFVQSRPAGQSIGNEAIQRLYGDFGVEQWSLADRGYIARLHPLELWLAGYLASRPGATLSAALAASQSERHDAYRWLIKSKRYQAQNKRIRIILEEEAFKAIHAVWRSLGYPFDSLVPSLATALGSSADRPDALAELMGIIVNDGVRRATIRFESFDFAAETPYEVRLAAGHDGSERVLPAEVATVVRSALLDVVEKGTGRRAAGAVRAPDGSPIAIGGKTGTGDHRNKYFRGGQLVREEVVNRNACFVFFIGERYFGTIVAHVKGPEAAEYHFTSALPTQVLRVLGPALAPLFEERQEVAG